MWSRGEAVGGCLFGFLNAQGHESARAEDGLGVLGSRAHLHGIGASRHGDGVRAATMGAAAAVISCSVGCARAVCKSEAPVRDVEGDRRRLALPRVLRGGVEGMRGRTCARKRHSVELLPSAGTGEGGTCVQQQQRPEPGSANTCKCRIHHLAQAHVLYVCGLFGGRLESGHGGDGLMGTRVTGGCASRKLQQLDIFGPMSPPCVHSRDSRFT